MLLILSHTCGRTKSSLPDLRAKSLLTTIVALLISRCLLSLLLWLLLLQSIAALGVTLSQGSEP